MIVSLCWSMITQTCFLHFTLLQCVMMLLWWRSYHIPLLFQCPLSGSCNEVVWQWNLSGIFLIHHWRPAWLSSYRKCIKHELKMIESNLHWLGQRMWMLLILYQTTQSILFLFPILGDDIPGDGKASRLSVECHTCWGLGSLALVREELCEGDARTLCCKEKESI